MFVSTDYSSDLKELNANDTCGILVDTRESAYMGSNPIGTFIATFGRCCSINVSAISVREITMY